MRLLLLIYLLQISIFCSGTALPEKEYVSGKVDQSRQIVKDSPDSSTTTEQVELLKKRIPELMFNKFSKDASKLDFSQVKASSYIIMSQGSDALKKSFMNLLYKYKDKSILCSFELGRILLYCEVAGGKQKEGLTLIEKTADKGLAEAVDTLIKYYSITKNRKKEFYYLEKAALKGRVDEKFVYYCIKEKSFDKARKYFALYIQDLKDKIHGLEDGKIEMKNQERKDDFIRSMKQKIKDDEKFFFYTIKKAEKENNFSEVNMKLHY